MAGAEHPTEHPSHDPGPSNPEATPTPPPQPNAPPLPPPPNQPRPPSQPRDYIIQVPKDQVVRAPPPGNQRLLERNASRKRHSGCPGCCCCFCVTLVLLVLALAAAAGVLYLVFRPKNPSYSVQSLAIGGLNVSSPTFNTDHLSPEINVSITADNPNKRIGFYYRDGSSIDVYYSGSFDKRLCSGEWPAFYHGKRNETLVKVALREEEGVRLTEKEEDEMREGARKRRVPLNVNVDVEVNIKFGALKLWKMTVKVRCDVVVNELSPDAKVVSSDCDYKVDVV